MSLKAKIFNYRLTATKQSGFLTGETLLAVFLLLFIVLVAAYVYVNHKNNHKADSSSAISISPPSVSKTNIYLGAWVNPTHTTLGQKGNKGGPGSIELQQLSSFNQSIGRSLAILHVYTPFNQPVPIGALNAIAANGSIPLIDWSCSNISNVINGSDNSLIATYAKTLKAFAKPVFLRWYWEMNLRDNANKTCDGYGNGSAYISAWQHIWNIFQEAQATNVAFVWCPSAQSNAQQYYPGDKYVDWIAADGYDRKHTGTLAFKQIFGGWYNEWLGRRKPLMIAETGAMTIDQAAYIKGIEQGLPSNYRQIKALVYFDSIGPAGSWALQGSGLAEFRTMSHSTYFSYK